MAGRYFTICANDDDHDDVGTTYWLLDDHGRVVASHEWPMPLERLAADLGAMVARVATQAGQMIEARNDNGGSPT